MKRFALSLLMLLAIVSFAAASDVSITAANVVAQSGSTVERGTAGATITAGQVLYRDASDSNKLKLADNDDGAAKATAVGIALNGASAGQPIAFITAGNLTAGGTLTEGEIYVVSSTAGGLAPEADNATQNDYVTVVGVAVNATTLMVDFINSGGQIP